MINAAYNLIEDFLYQGGPVLVGIFIVTILMWFLILERYYYYFFNFSNDLKKSTEYWDTIPNKYSWIAKKIRQLELSRLHLSLDKNIRHIKTLVAICPLLGLCGTVIGMISVFETMAAVGTGNARLMASGISMATIPTMAGMVCALSGIYLGSQLDNQSKKKKELASKNLYITQEELGS